jgi:hypothetical protein
MGKHHFTIALGNGRARRWNCLDCRRRVFYGDRCPDCQQRLRQRQRRKPR